jgi:hypothetical protein
VVNLQIKHMNKEKIFKLYFSLEITRMKVIL